MENLWRGSLRLISLGIILLQVANRLVTVSGISVYYSHFCFSIQFPELETVDLKSLIQSSLPIKFLSPG